MLVVSEHELIEIEQRFARKQNIPIRDALIRVPINQKPKHRPALLPEKLCQWRLMFFFHYVTDFIVDTAYYDLKDVYLQYKFFNHKSCFKLDFSHPTDDPKTALHSPAGSRPESPNGGTKLTSEGQRGTLRDPALFTKIMDTKVETAAPTRKKNKFGPGAHQMNIIRCHYLFSETAEINKFLDETNVRLTPTSLLTL